MTRTRLLTIVCLLLQVAAGTLAAETHWTVNPHAFQYDMTVYVQLEVARQSDYEVAAFCGDECRGVGKLLTAADGTQLFQLRIRSNEPSGETMSFRVWKPSEEKEFWPEPTVDFVSQTVVATPSEPLVLQLDDGLSGDANNDGDVNIADVTAIINFINGTQPATFSMANADVNGDGDINIADITGVINIINQ